MVLLVLKAQLISIETLKNAGTICPYVFHRADGSQIKDFGSEPARALTRHAATTSYEHGQSNEMFSDFAAHVIGVPQIALWSAM